MSKTLEEALYRFFDDVHALTGERPLHLILTYKSFALLQDEMSRKFLVRDFSKLDIPESATFHGVSVSWQPSSISGLIPTGRPDRYVDVIFGLEKEMDNFLKDIVQKNESNKFMEMLREL